MEYNYYKIGERIAERRKAFGYKSQTDFIYALSQENVHISRNTLSKIESGNLAPEKFSVPLLLAMCKLLSCDAGYLLGEQKEFRKDITTASEITGLSYENIEKITKQDKEKNTMLDMLISHKSFSELLSCCWAYLHSSNNQLLLMSSPYSKDFRFTEEDAGKIYKFSASDIFSSILGELFKDYSKHATEDYEQSLILELLDIVQNYINNPNNAINQRLAKNRYKIIQEKLIQIESTSLYATISFKKLEEELKNSPINITSKIPNDYVTLFSHKKDYQP